MNSDPRRRAEDRDTNRRAYETAYSARNYAPQASDDVFGRLFAAKLAAVRATLRPGARALDLCCGSGEVLRRLAADGVDVVGVDFSAPILAELRAAYAAAGGDPAHLVLHRADARTIPEPDASFDVVACFSSLYTIPGADDVFAEIARVLKPGGRATLELGAERSLNALEARRVGSGVRSYHLRPWPALRRLADLGLAVVEDRAFQLFPCWGGGTNRAQHVLNPLLARRLAVVGDDGRTLDETLSSSPLLRPFAFRRLLTLERTTPAAARAVLAVRRAAERAAASAALADRDLRRAERAERRAAADLAASRGYVSEAAALYVSALAADPHDLDAALGLANLYDGVEERAAVARWRALGDRAARAMTRPPAARPAASATVSAPAAPPSAAVAPAPAPAAAGGRATASSDGVPRVSVVLPTYNQADFLPRAVDSVLAQTFRDFELIVVDDGSTDGTAAYLATLRDPRVRVVRQDNARLPGALNRGFSVARGALFTWTSSDNLVAPAWLETLVAALDAHPACGLAVAAFSWIDERDRIRRVTRDQDVSFAAFLTRNPGNAAFLYRADLARAVGGYEPALEGAEDWDYWIRLAERAPVVYVDANLYLYREHAASMTATIPRKVADGSRETFRRAIARLGDEIDVARVYPGVAACADRAAAERDAAFDLGVRMLKSPWCDPLLAARCFEAVLEDSPAAGMAAANLALAYAKGGRFAEAAELVGRFDASAHPTAALIAARVEKAATDGALEGLVHVPPFVLTAENSELLRAEAALRRVFAGAPPAAARAVATPRATARPAASAPAPLHDASPAAGLSFVILTNGARPESLANVVASIRGQRLEAAEILVVGAGGAPPGARFLPAEDDARAGRLGAMRNRGFAAARFDAVAILDDDVFLAPDWAERFAEYRTAHADFAVVTSQVRLPDGSRYWDRTTHGGPSGHRVLDVDEPAESPYATGGGGIMVARRVFERVGYDATRGFYEGEDLDFAARVRAAGFSIDHAHACVVWHADPSYSGVGRLVHRRRDGKSAADVCAPYTEADAATLLAAARAEHRANGFPEAADLLRFGAARFPENRRLATELDRLERQFGGRLKDARWFVDGDPAFRALTASFGGRNRAALAAPVAVAERQGAAV
jgi:glycosyltransferase involved in cell wall biosynthesis/SAM-dependent methyltransferase